MKKKVLIFGVFGVLALLGVILVVSKQKEKESLPVAQTIKSSISVVRPKEREVLDVAIFSAKLESENELDISTKVSGYVEEVLFVENQHVKKGDTLIKIESGELGESIEQLKLSKSALNSYISSLKSGLTALKKESEIGTNTHKRNQKLFSAGALAKEKLDESELMMEQKNSKLDSTLEMINSKEYELKALEHQIKSKLAQMEYHDIKSPIDGVVTNVYIKKGELIAPSKPLVHISDKKQKLTFLFDSSQNIKAGQKVVAEGVSGVISKVYERSKSYLLEAEVLPSSALDKKTGEIVELQVIKNSVKALSIPQKSVLKSGEKSYVFELENGIFVKKEVEILAQDSMFVAVANEIKNQVAVAAPSKLATLAGVKDFMIVESIDGK